MGVSGVEGAFAWIGALLMTLVLTIGMFDRRRYLRKLAKNGAVNPNDTQGVRASQYPD